MASYIAILITFWHEIGSYTCYERQFEVAIQYIFLLLKKSNKPSHPPYYNKLIRIWDFMDIQWWLSGNIRWAR